MNLLPKYGSTPKFPESLDSSMITAYQRCARLFYLEYIMGLRPRGEERIALTYGTVWHQLQEMKSTVGFKQAFEWAEANIDDLLPSWEEKKNRTGSRMLGDFAAHYATYRDVDDKYEVLGVEIPFDIQLGHLRYCGKIDEILLDPRRGEMFVKDFKTSTFVMPSYHLEKEMSLQFKGYVWAAQQLFPDLKFGGFILDLYHILKNDSKFVRKVFMYHPSLIAEWEQTTLRIMEEIYVLCESAFSEEDFLMNWRGCGEFGGCAFADAHRAPADGEHRERLISASFEESRWDPINQQQEGVS